MNPPRPDQFTEFFQALHGRTPYQWQMTLADRACRGRWPTALDLPTASGKTACIDIAIFALACQAALPAEERTAPRRVLFVVDRRVIVDEAFERARAIADCLRDPGGAAVLVRTAHALRQVGGLAENEDPLACFQLRGGMYRDQAWARTPTQPTVIASTVDQIGSRLLFRGYGLSNSMWPIHAGLAANDSLILLDEAHCSRPFLQTVTAISKYRGWAAPDAPKSPFHFVVLSATLPEEFCEKPEDVLKLGEKDRGPDQLGPRLQASKPASLVVENVPGGNKGHERFAGALINQAISMLRPPDIQAVAILVNRVRTARLVYEQLDHMRKWDTERPHLMLLIGRMRPLDRDRLMETWKDRLKADPGRPPRERPIIVVATQCLEVGADYDFDGMVTECASLDAIRQRFGRLNRTGRPIVARGAVVIRSDQVRSEAEIKDEAPAKKDPIYGDALPRTWNWLKEIAVENGAGQVVDFGIDAIKALLPEDPAALQLLQTPSPDAPIVLPAHIDCWAQTASTPWPDPDVALFLHGPDQGRPEVQVCWRADLMTAPGLSGIDRQERWVNAVSLCPPAAAECMRVPLSLVRDWLGSEKAPTDDDGDLESGRAIPLSDDLTLTKSALRWRGPENPETCLIADPTSDVRPGDTLVLPVSQGGWNVLGFIPRNAEDESDEDVRRVDHGLAEDSQYRFRRRAILRIHPEILEHWPAGPTRETLRRIACDEEDPTECQSELLAALSELARDKETPPWLQGIAERLAGDGKLKILIHPDHPSNAPADLAPEEVRNLYPGGLVLSGSKRYSRTSESMPGDSETTEDDTASGSVSVPLADHSMGVALRTARFARHCGLSRPLRRALIAAACWHDLGKADPRMQVWLNNGLRLAASSGHLLLAKSERLPQSRRQRSRARARSGYPVGARHELLSVRLAEQLLDRIDRAVDRDLVLHLIASHHGHCRPFAPLVQDLEPVSVCTRELGLPARASSDTRLHELDSGVAERYWTLVKRYGWWGLAWLETLLRLADHRESEREQTPAEGGQ